MLADAGYCNERDLKELEERDIDAYVAVAREGKAAPNIDREKHPAKARMAEKLASEEGQKRYARRTWQAEAPIGWIKEVVGFGRSHPPICTAHAQYIPLSYVLQRKLLAAPAGFGANRRLRHSRSRNAHSPRYRTTGMVLRRAGP